MPILAQIMHTSPLFLIAKDAMRYTFFVIFCLFLLTACNKIDAPEANTHAPSTAPEKTTNEATSITLKDGTYCFSKRFNQDVTDVQLTILGSAITGKMDWIPYQKDSARGTLQGAVNDAGELDLMYDYMIEGNQQTETKVMKIEDGKLQIKIGELQDLKYNGNLTYKDVNQAKYSDVLTAVACK